MPRVLARISGDAAALAGAEAHLLRARRFFGPVADVETVAVFNGRGVVAAVRRTGETRNVYTDAEARLVVVLSGSPQHGRQLVSADVFARRYLEGGPDAAAGDLDGAWTAVVVDERAGRCRVFRDRVGAKPIYYRETDGEVVIGANAGMLVKAGWVPAAVNRNTVARYASSNYRAVFGRRESFFDGVRLVPPASFLDFEPGGEVAIRSYWDADPAAPFLDAPDEEIGRQFRGLLEQVVDDWRACWSHCRTAVALSGGIDSGTIAGLMHGAAGTRVDALSVTYAEQTDFNETHLMKCSVRDHIADWHDVRLTADVASEAIPRLYDRFDLPLSTVSIFGYDFLLREAAARGVEVLFTGSGGDAVLAGTYPCYLFALADLKAGGSPRYRDELAAWIGHHSTAQFPKSEATADEFFARAVDLAQPGVLKRHELPLASGILDHDFRRAAGPLAIEVVPSYGTYLRSYAMQEYRFDDIAPGAEAEDMMAWQWGAAMLSPFLARDVIEFGWRVPHDSKIRHGVNKVLARTALRGICADEVLDEVAKSGFNVPFDLWLRGALRGFVQDVFSARRFRERGIYDPRRFQAALDAHLAGDANYQMLLWQALNLELWMRAWIDAGDDSAKHAQS